MNDAIRKADVLIEALSYIRTFRDKLTVIKLGGSAMEDADALRATLQDVLFMETVGLRPVLVHGGGKPIDRAMAAAGIEPRKVQGRRYTDDATLEIVVRVLGEINAKLVADLKGLGCWDAEGFANWTARHHPIRATRLTLTGPDHQPIDLGHVGQPAVSSSDDFRGLVLHGLAVLPSFGSDSAGGWLNINADTLAGAVAGALKSEHCLF